MTHKNKVILSWAAPAVLIVLVLLIAIFGFADLLKIILAIALVVGGAVLGTYLWQGNLETFPAPINYLFYASYIVAVLVAFSMLVVFDLFQTFPAYFLFTCSFTAVSMVIGVFVIKNIQKSIKEAEAKDAAEKED